MRTGMGAEERLAGRQRVAVLCELYGGLLTERQRELLSWYYDLDLSLREIAQQEQVSRQAVHDLVRRAVAALERYERGLGLAERAERQTQARADLLAALAAAADADRGVAAAALRRAVVLAEGLLEE